MVRFATGDIVQALFVRDGNQHEWSQGTPVQVHLPAEALRVLPPRHARDIAASSSEAAPDAAAAVEVGSS